MKKAMLVLFLVCLALYPIPALCAPDTYEPDDAVSQSGLIVLGGLSESHNFHSVTDADWKRFYALSGQTYTVKVSYPGPDCDAVIELYDTDGLTLLKTKDDALAGEGEFLDWACPADGIYYVKIAPYPASSIGENTNYILNVYRANSCMTGTYTGTVTDALSGSPLGSAKLWTDEGDSALSDANGNYRMTVCTMAKTLNASLEGYENHTAEVTLQVQEEKVHNILLNSSRHLKVTPGGSTMGPFSGTVNFDISNTGSGVMEWQASVAPAYADWLSVSGEKSGTNGGSIAVEIAANAGEERKGYVIIAAEGAAGSPAQLEIVQQAAVPADISVKPPAHDFGTRQVNPPEARSVKKKRIVPRETNPIIQLSSDYIESQVIIKMNANRRAGDENVILNELNANVVEQYSSIGAQLWEMSGTTVKEALFRFWDNPALEYIEPNYKLNLVGTLPDDASFAQLWGLHNTAQTGGKEDADIDAPEAWELLTGNQETVVAVIDTGVDYTHPDLAANMWVNPGEIPGNGVDDDGNGYIDDIHGYNFTNDSGNPFDDHGHGTHCAGTIAALVNNGTGIVGVNPTAKIMALKFINKNNVGTTTDAIKALEYAVKMGVKISNNSWGGGGYSDALHQAVLAASAAGHVIVAAAGNDYGQNNDAVPHYPSGYDADNVISVAATDHNDLLAFFSNYGFTTVDLAAPGAAIYSTVPGNAYASYNGTSMATPHVSGVVSLIRSLYPDISPANIRQSIISTVDPIPSLMGLTFSGGRLNAYSALMAFGQFTVVNTGTRLLNISAVSLGGENPQDFGIENDGCSGKTLGYYESCAVKLNFTPTSIGQKKAVLTVLSDDPDTPSMEVPLSGKGSTDFRLVLSRTGEGDVKVNQVLCPQYPGYYTYESGTPVLLEAQPAEEFRSWGGDLAGSENPVQVEMTQDMNITAVFKDEFADSWQAEIHAASEIADGVSYSEWQLSGENNILVNSYKIVIGVSSRDITKAAPPVPPEYSVKADLWDIISAEDWRGPYGKLIRKGGADKYQWVLGINPHGTLPPPVPRSSFISWNPEELDPKGTYQIREGYDGAGAVIIENMRTETSLEIRGDDSTQFFTIELIPEGGGLGEDVKGDLNNDRKADLKDVISGLQVLAGEAGDIRSDYSESEADVNGDGTVGLEEVIWLLGEISGQ
ncbi:MAG: S8 family serine peptidase [Desulfococcaceae bacterium]|nr:S8 family serine peptidase [Desulfococcaceae bacterium]